MQHIRLIYFFFYLYSVYISTKGNFNEVDFVYFIINFAITPTTLTKELFGVSFGDDILSF